uniref:Aos n=1 Tax=Arundo donax TaxID=35708 RepID=A0A0A9A4B5_ARUDO
MPSSRPFAPTSPCSSPPSSRSSRTATSPNSTSSTTSPHLTSSATSILACDLQRRSSAPSARPRWACGYCGSSTPSSRSVAFP